MTVINPVLFDNINADDTSTERIYNGGKGLVHVRFDAIGTGVINIQVKSLNDSLNRWVDLSVPQPPSVGTDRVTDITFPLTEIIEELKSAVAYRAVLSGSLASASNVFVEIN